MSSYDAHLTITVPASMADVAAMVGRAMDPDTGGIYSFTADITGYDGETPVYGDTTTCRTVCRPEFKARALAMLADPAILWYACQQDYAQRWPDATPPTLEQCATFITAAEVV